MNTDNQKAIQELLKSFSYLVEEALKKTTKTYDGIIVSPDKDKWKIKYNGEIHSVKMYGSGTPKIKTIVKVFVPQGNQALAWFFIPNDNGSSPTVEDLIWNSDDGPLIYWNEDGEGNIYWNIDDGNGNNTQLVLPQASSNKLGGIKANARTAEEDQLVSIDPFTGFLYTKRSATVEEVLAALPKWEWGSY